MRDKLTDAICNPALKKRTISGDPDNPDDPDEKERIKSLWLDASEKLIKAGAFFDRPYGL